MKTHELPCRRRRGVLRLNWLTAALLGAGVVPVLAQVLPSGFTTPTGNVSYVEDQASATMTIKQDQSRAIAHWSDFSIGAGATVNVVQPDPSSVLLNRVITDTTSQIDGTLNANGHVYLINPWGVLFGAGAQVNVGGIVASTLDLAGETVAERNARFMEDGVLEFASDGAGAERIELKTGAVIRSHAGAGGMVVLLGGRIENRGTLDAPGGTVALGVGDRITLDPVGDGLTTLRIDEGSFAESAVGILNDAGAQITADGGRVLLLARSAYGSFSDALISQQGLIRARRLASSGGEIVLQASGDSEFDEFYESSGIELGAGGVLDADGVGTASGGRVEVTAGNGSALVVDGALTARGGTGGADGGWIETSGQTFWLGADLSVDASASAGAAGAWVLDPSDVHIAPGGVDPAPANTVYDSTISGVLDGGTSMAIVTPAGGLENGNVDFADGTQIVRSQPGAPVTFAVQAANGISAGKGVAIRSAAGAGALNVALLAGTAATNPDAVTDRRGQLRFDGTIASNGGNVALGGAWAQIDAPGAGVFTNGATLDSTALDPASRGDGSITIQGLSVRASGGGSNFGEAAVDLVTTHVNSGRGATTVTGIDAGGTGVRLAGETLLETSSGPVAITGAGQAGPDFTGGPPGSGSGVLMDLAGIETGSGDVTVRGLWMSGVLPGATSAGVSVVRGAFIDAGGNLEITGSASGPDAGVRVAGDADLGETEVRAGGHATLRAGNNGEGDAIVIDELAGVQAGGMLNLRPGGTDGSTWADRPADSIGLGAAIGMGFALSPEELARLSAGTAVVVGSDAHAGPITVNGAISVPYALTLQNGAGGGIQLDAPVQAPQLTLDSGGSIGQGVGAHVEAGELLARSRGGDVDLQYVENDAGALAGAAAGDFAYVDSNALTVQPLSHTGASTAINAPQAIQVAALQGGQVLVRTLNDDLTLDMPASSSAGTDLVAAARFQNPGAGSIGGAPWRVWADTWEGETRGGMAGSGPLPNLYGCTYDGSCGVTVSAADNHFIYTQQPTATVTINDVTRPVGLPNPPFGATVSGLRPGDSAAAIHGDPTTDATASSPVGSYEINGDYASDAGYQLEVVPGTLKVVDGGLPGDTPSLDLPEDTPTWAGNLGGAPICLASAPLDGDRAEAEGDVLAREWSRVRVRPRLTSCIDSSRRNACSDF
jgi:filamentous hemagglutinin family protein